MDLNPEPIIMRHGQSRELHKLIVQLILPSGWKEGRFHNHSGRLYERSICFDGDHCLGSRTWYCTCARRLLTLVQADEPRTSSTRVYEKGGAKASKQIKRLPSASWQKHTIANLEIGNNGYSPILYLLSRFFSSRVIPLLLLHRKSVSKCLPLWRPVPRRKVSQVPCIAMAYPMDLVVGDCEIWSCTIYHNPKSTQYTHIVCLLPFVSSLILQKSR